MLVWFDHRNQKTKIGNLHKLLTCKYSHAQTIMFLNAFFPSHWSTVSLSRLCKWQIQAWPTWRDGKTRALPWQICTTCKILLLESFIQQMAPRWLPVHITETGISASKHRRVDDSVTRPRLSYVGFGIEQFLPYFSGNRIPYLATMAESSCEPTVNFHVGRKKKEVTHEYCEGTLAWRWAQVGRLIES